MPIPGELLGYLDVIDDAWAHVTIENNLGDVFHLTLLASAFRAAGVSEGESFRIRLAIEAIPRIEVSDAEAQAIAKEMREAFPGDDLNSIEY